MKDVAESRMQKALESVGRDFAKIRTGHANPSLLENVSVEYYGNATPISQVAAVTVPDARTLVISPWEGKLLGAIEKAIFASELGLTPTNDGKVIRISLPPLTEERRKELAKICKKYAEEARVAVRNIRRDVNDAYKKKAKDEGIAQDAEKKMYDEIQKITDKYIAKIDEALVAKEKEIMTI